MTGVDYLIGTLIGLTVLVALSLPVLLVIRWWLHRADEHDEVLERSRDEK